MDNLIKGVYLFRQLSEDIKEKNNIKVGAVVPRFDIVGFNGDYDFIKPLINKRNMCFLSLTETYNFVKADQRRMADYALRNNSIGNLTSLFYNSKDNEGKFFGNTNDSKTIKVGQNTVPNPLLAYEDHLLLIKLSDDKKELVLIVVKGGRSFCQFIYTDFVNGKYDDLIHNKLQFLNTDFGYTL
jgi:hypothetical protein